MNRLTTEQQKRVVAALVEGNSIRATVRMTGVAKNTIVKLLADLGKACAEFQHKTLRNLPCKRVQCDEIWSFVYSKDKNTPQNEKDAGEAGDVWTWTAIDADSKLIVSWRVGKRDSETGMYFMRDLASRLANRVQLTTDAFTQYRALVGDAFHGKVDYAMLVKVFRATPGDSGRYSPGECHGTHAKIIRGDPDENHISTSYAERQNLTMRMSMRRFTRLTNAFSKKVENHAHAVALHFMYYNFCRIHQSLRITPAMAAGVSKHVWEIDEMLALMAESMQAAA